MEATKLQFLTAVLGDSGASALVKASERSEVLEHALVPRTILAWIGAAPTFEGHVPGIDAVYVTFQKSESGFSGSVTVEDGLYKFENQSLFHVAATVAVAMGIEEDHVHPDLRAVDIERLGKSIDMLVKVRRAGEELEKSADKPDKTKDGTMCEDCGKAWKGHDSVLCSEELEKGATSGTGAAAAPQAPKPPEAPVATAPATPKTSKPMSPKGSKSPKTTNTLRLSEPETSRRCRACGIPQFDGEDFAGCACFSALSKSARVVSRDGGVVTLELKSEWDADAILTFLEAIGR